MRDPSLTLTQFCALLKTVLFCRAYEILPQHLCDSLDCKDWQLCPLLLGVAVLFKERSWQSRSHEGACGCLFLYGSCTPLFTINTCVHLCIPVTGVSVLTLLLLTLAPSISKARLLVYFPSERCAHFNFFLPPIDVCVHHATRHRRRNLEETLILE